MKKPPFNTNYQKPLEKVHIPNKIVTDVEGFEKENQITSLEEFYKLIPNPRIKKEDVKISIGNDLLDEIFKEGVHKKDVVKISSICNPSSCPLTFMYIPTRTSVKCSKCGQIVNNMSPTF